MTFTKSAGLAALACVASVEAAEVVQLSGDNFDSTLEKANTLVKFYAPWCGHCKKLAPEYVNAAAEISDVQLAEIDCDKAENKPVCGKYGVQGFPTLKWFPKGGEAMEYDGGRTKDTIIDWVTEIVKPVVQEVDLAPTEAGPKISVILTGPELTEDFSSTAQKHRKHGSFFFVKSDGDAKVVLLKSGEGEIAVDGVDADSVSKAVNDNRFPLFGELNGETFADYNAREGKKLLWVLIDFEGKSMADAVAPLREGFETLAKEYDAYSFTYTDTVQFKGAIEGMLGITQIPALCVQDGAKKYILPDTIAIDKVKTFLDGIAAGTIEATVKSEDIPASQDKAVRHVVAKALQDEIFNDKDVLLKVYAPWCGHCKNMAPDYEAAAEALSVLGIEDKVWLGKLDGTLNDSTVDGLEWSGFPTIVFVPANSKEFVKFDGARTKAGILEWIAGKSEQADVKKITASEIGAALERKELADEDDEDDKEEL